jgi:hypothetical protein
VATDAAKARKFTPERNTPFVFVLAYPTDSVQTNALLYEMAHFNFTTFVVRGFDMEVSHEKGLSQLCISGFNSFDEAHAYASRVFKDKNLVPYLRKGRVMLISKQNLELIGTTFSINDYQKFYDSTFAPVKLPADLPLETAPVEQHYEDEYTPEQLERINSGSSSDDNTTNDDGEWY